MSQRSGAVPLFASPPESVCLLRLSSIGDVCHAIALLRAFQGAWPTTRFTWIAGKAEAKLLALKPLSHKALVTRALMGRIYAHFHSLENFARLYQRAAAKQTAT